MNGKCSKWKDCESYKKIGCKGCGYQHFDKIDLNNEALLFLDENYFKLCSEMRAGTGGRIALDEPMRKLILEKAGDIFSDFPPVEKLESSSLRSNLLINNEEVEYEIKCDGAFSFENKYIFYELKGYGMDTNSILSAITASNLVKEDTKYLNHCYYYMGCCRLRREDYFNSKSRKVTPYIKWAESKNILKFYGILDILDFLEDIKNYLNG